MINDNLFLCVYSATKLANTSTEDAENALSVIDVSTFMRYQTEPRPTWGLLKASFAGVASEPTKKRFVNRNISNES